MSAYVELKIWSEYFDAVEDGRKTFEVRKEDRHYFREGDVLCLREWEPVHLEAYDSEGEYTGREVFATVGYVVRGPFPAAGLPKGTVVLGLTDVVRDDRISAAGEG